MNKISFVLIFLLSQIGCQNQQITLASSENIKLPIKTISENTTSNSSNKNIISETPNDDTTYPGKTIDEIFPFIAEHDFMEENFKGKTYSEKVDKFEITIKNFAPKMIIKDGKTIFNFKTLYPNEYHSNLIGVSHLLGKNSKQIYVVSGGPGGVCCTNYWITEVSGKTPRNIFRSEDFGSFRDAMEIFDADGDGIYELVQFDSAFRYFMDDCGSCSPEPKAVFKYDKKLGTYLPAKHIQQDFEKENFKSMEIWLAESFEKIKMENEPSLENQFHRSLKAHVVNLLWIGEEKKAWEIFNTYMPKDSFTQKVHKEIKRISNKSKFFQLLRNQK